MTARLNRGEVRLTMTFLRSFLITFAVASTFARCFAGPIDFAPTTGHREVEGIVFPQVVFHQDGHAISYEPPKGWTYTGDSTQFRLTPPKTTLAQAQIGQSLLPAPQTFDEATIKQLQQIVISSLPGDAKNVQLVPQEPNTIRINQQPSVEVVVSYTYFGQDYLASVTFANLGDLQLRFRIVARKAEFEALHRAFRASLFSLHWS
jgi:hypothetical protein